MARRKKREGGTLRHVDEAYSMICIDIANGKQLGVLPFRCKQQSETLLTEMKLMSYTI